MCTLLLQLKRTSNKRIVVLSKILLTIMDKILCRFSKQALLLVSYNFNIL